MKNHHDAPDPGAYELRVDRHLDDHWSAWFGDLALKREPDGTTTLSGPVPDQAALHGHLSKIRDLGMTLISVQAMTREPGDHSPSPTQESDPQGAQR